MSIIYILIPIAILLTALGVYLFFWAVKTDQFEDLEKQGMSILFDETDENAEENVLSKTKDLTSSNSESIITESSDNSTVSDKNEH